MMMSNFEKIMAQDQGEFAQFIGAMDALLDATDNEKEILSKARGHLAQLISSDSWLPKECATPSADRYAQHLLHLDPSNRYCVVSFVWGPGQATPVHDHTVWGLVGVLKGAELCDEYTLHDGQPQPQQRSHVLKQGQIEAVSPTIGDWHRVSNHLSDRDSISIHVYGGDIGTIRRHMVNAQGEVTEFVSGYSTR